MMQVPPSLTDTLKQIDQLLNFGGSLTPKNLQEEREKFLQNLRINPVFIYPDLDQDVLTSCEQQLREIGQIEQDGSLETWVIGRKISEMTLKVKLLQHRGQAEMNAISCQLFTCLFTQTSLEQAEKDAAQPLKFENQESKPPEEIVTGIRDYLHSYGVDDWEVKLVSDTDFYFRVKAQLKQVLISERFNFDFCDFDNTLAHEIDGHVLRGINAQRQTNQLLKKPLPFYIKTEEGLASFLADYCSTTADISRKHHALKYLAGHLAQISTFVETFEFLVESGFTPDLAFQRTFRLKRGYADTTVHGCFAKEAMYYEGMLEVKEYLDRGESVEKLYSGKFGLADLEFITAVPENVLVPERLKQYLANKV